jgi:hypothetical protein
MWVKELWGRCRKISARFDIPSLAARNDCCSHGKLLHMRMRILLVAFSFSIDACLLATFEPVALIGYAMAKLYVHTVVNNHILCEETARTKAAEIHSA